MQRRNDIERHKKFAQDRIDNAAHTVPKIADPVHPGVLIPDPRYDPNDPSFDPRVAGELFPFRVASGTHTMLNGMSVERGGIVLLTKAQAMAHPNKFERVHNDDPGVEEALSQLDPYNAVPNPANPNAVPFDDDDETMLQREGETDEAFNARISGTHTSKGSERAVSHTVGERPSTFSGPRPATAPVVETDDQRASRLIREREANKSPEGSVDETDEQRKARLAREKANVRPVNANETDEQRTARLDAEKKEADKKAGKTTIV